MRRPPHRPSLPGILPSGLACSRFGPCLAGAADRSQHRKTALGAMASGPRHAVGRPYARPSSARGRQRRFRTAALGPAHPGSLYALRFVCGSVLCVHLWSALRPQPRAPAGPECPRFVCGSVLCVHLWSALRPRPRAPAGPECPRFVCGSVLCVHLWSALRPRPRAPAAFYARALFAAPCARGPSMFALRPRFACLRSFMSAALRGSSGLPRADRPANNASGNAPSNLSSPRNKRRAKSWPNRGLPARGGAPATAGEA